jgi:lysophospholipase L1-like esterase
MRRAAVKVLKLIPVWIVGLIGVLLLVEMAYRLSPFDPYRVELGWYNAVEDLAGSDPRPTLLCMGDSLTAGVHSWPATVREHRPDLRVINAGIPGSGIVQANLSASRRFRRLDPDVFVYQINATNDLFNLRYPIRWSRLSPVRNAYWTLAHRLRSLEYLNYRAGQLAFSVRHREWLREQEHAERRPASACGWVEGAFRPDSFHPGPRAYLRGEPGLYQDQILLRGRRARDHHRLLAGLDRLLAHCRPPECTARVLVVPHALQVEPRYMDQMRAMGAELDDPSQLTADGYPLLDSIQDALPPGVRVVDPLAALRERVRSGDHVFFRYDLHLNDCGQQVLAQAVLDSLGP